MTKQHERLRELISNCPATISGNSRLLLIVLAIHADENWLVDITRSDLIRETRMCSHTLTDQLATLTAAGLLRSGWEMIGGKRVYVRRIVPDAITAVQKHLERQKPGVEQKPTVEEPKTEASATEPSYTVKKAVEKIWRDLRDWGSVEVSDILIAGHKAYIESRVLDRFPGASFAWTLSGTTVTVALPRGRREVTAA